MFVQSKVSILGSNRTFLLEKVHNIPSGLELCVKLLRARKAWCPDCERLQTEIVCFARRHTETVAEQNITFSLT